MNRSRALRVAICSGATLLALGLAGCAQIAGLSGDYQLAAGGTANTGGRDGAGGTNSGIAGRSNAEAGSGLGEAGANVGAAGANAGEAGFAGAAGDEGGASGGEAGSGAGTAGLGGAGGAAPTGPTRVGFSEFHDSASGSDDASAGLTDATFDMPAGTRAGDFILVFFGADHSLMKLSGNELGSGGWTLLEDHHDYGTDGQATYLIYKFAGTSEPDQIVFPGINPVNYGDGVQGLLSVYRGVNAQNPINAYEFALNVEDGSGTTFSTATPAITTTVDDCRLITGLSPDTTVDRPAIVFWPAGFSENQVSVLNPTSPHPDAWANIYSAERHLPKAGTVDASSFAWQSSSGSIYHGSLAFVLALAP